MSRLRTYLLLALLLAIFALFIALAAGAVCCAVAFFGDAQPASRGISAWDTWSRCFRIASCGAGLFTALRIAIGVTFVLHAHQPALALFDACDTTSSAACGQCADAGAVDPAAVCCAIGMRQILGRYGCSQSGLNMPGLASPASRSTGSAAGRASWDIILLESLSLYPILFSTSALRLANLDPQ
jgi:hypothetical protein